MTGSPFVTRNPSLGIAALSENALPVIRWQPVQWQAMVRSGGAVILNRTLPQRHPPSRDTFESLISCPRGVAVAAPIIHAAHLTQNPIGIAEVEFLASIDGRLRFREIAL